MSVSKAKKINQMFLSRQKNGLLFASWLIEQGYSKQLLSRYRSSAWLSSLCKGLCTVLMIICLLLVFCSPLTIN